MPGVLSIASLPDLAEPAALAFGAGVGAFLASTAHRALGKRLERERRAEWIEHGTYVGFAFAFSFYVVLNVLEVVS